MMGEAQNAYLESRIAGATPVELIAILYQAAQTSLRDARRHLESGDIPQRAREISRCMEILTELRGSLDIDAGGGLARRLASLYDYMLGRLLDANVRQQAEPLCEVTALLATLGEAWQAVATPSEPAVESYAPWQSDFAESSISAGRVWSY
jgi:flagellar protein FliS